MGNGDLTIGGTNAPKFTATDTSKAAWVKSTGTLTLTANQAVTSGSVTLTVDLTNKASYVAAVTPTIAATIDATNDIAAAATTGNSKLDVAASSFSVKSVDGNSN